MNDTTMLDRIAQLEDALRNVMPYAENEAAAIAELADDGDEQAADETETAAACVAAAHAALAHDWKR